MIKEHKKHPAKTTHESKPIPIINQNPESKHQWKNTFTIRKGDMAPPEPRVLTTARTEHSNTDEAQ